MMGQRTKTNKKKLECDTFSNEYPKAGENMEVCIKMKFNKLVGCKISVYI